MVARTQRNYNWWLAQWPALALGAAVLLVYAWSLTGGFIWDDRTYILDAPALAQPDALRRIWATRELTDFWPLSYTLFWAELRLFGQASTGYHVVSVLLHLGVVLSLWQVLRAIELRWAFWGALLFAVHPVNVEAVAWIFQQKTLLAALLGLQATLCFLAAPSPRHWRFWLAFALFGAALLAKAAVAPLPLTMGLALAWRTQRRPTRCELTALGLLGALAVAAVAANLAWYAAQDGPTVASELVRDDGWLARAAIGGRAFWFYLEKAALPLDLSFVYPRWQVADPPDAAALLPLAALFLVAATLAVGARLRQAWRAPAAVLTHVLALLAPVLGFVEIYYMRYSFVADHWQYLALMGIAALAGALGRWRPVAILAAMLLAATAVMHARAFRDEDTLWRDTLAKNPGSWMVHNAHGLDLKRHGAAAEAEAEYRAALALKPQAETYYNLAHLLEEGGRLAEAKPLYEQAATLNPYQARIFTNLGGVQARLGDLAAARASFVRAGALDDSAMTHYNLGFLLETTGDAAGALAQYERAVQLDPALAPAVQGLARLRAAR